MTELTPAPPRHRLPAAIRAHHHYPPLYESLVLVHVPHEDADWRRGMARLRYEEAFVLQAELARRRSVAAARPAVRRARVVSARCVTSSGITTIGAPDLNTISAASGST